MIKTEIRLLVPTVSPLIINGTFNSYTTGWITTGATVPTAEVYPNPIPTAETPSQYVAIDNPTGWYWKDGYMIAQTGSTDEIKQEVTITPNLIYNVQFTVKGYEYMSTGETLTVYLYGTSGTTIVNQDGRYNMDIEVTSTGETTLKFVPSANFAGAITAVELAQSTIVNQKLDLYDDDTFNLTFQIQSSISDKSASYSKTIRIPGTSNNNTVFNNLLDIGRYVDPAYLNDNKSVFINKKIRAGIYADSIELLIGYLELVKVIERNNFIEYECIFYSNIKSIADTIGDKLCAGNENSLDDLDFNEYNHSHNMGTITQGWYNAVGSSYYNSKGVFYPIIDYANITAGNAYRLENFKPALYVKEIWDKIFEKAGYTYTSSFLNSQTFKSLIIPVGNTLEEGNLYQDNTKFKIGISPSYSGETRTYTFTGFGSNYLFWEKVKFNKAEGDILFNGENGVVPFNTTTNDWTITSSGPYSLQASINYNVYIPSGSNIISSSLIPFYANVEMRIVRERTIGGLLTKQILATSQINSHLLLPFGTYTPPFYVISGNTSSLSISIEDIECYQYDKYYVEARTITPASSAGQWANTNPRALYFYDTLTANTGATPNMFVNAPDKLNYYMENTWVYCNDILPRKMKQLDFIKSISNKFNLSFAENRTTTNDIIIEPYDQFYLTGMSGITKNVIDWTYKIDYSKDIEFERVPDLLNKDVSFKFKDDSSDYLINKYKENNTSNFGDKLIKNNYYTESTEEINDLFSSAFLGSLGNTNWIVSKIYKGDEPNYTGLPEDCEYNYKVLSRKMLTNQRVFDKVYVTSYNLATTGITSSSNCRVITQLPLAWGVPYAGFLNDPIYPSLDLNYGEANYYNFAGLASTQLNLYNSYWRKKISAYTDINSRLLTVYLRLNYTDIAQLDFRKQYFLNGHLYRLQRVIEWVPNGSCKVELIQANALGEDAYVIPQGTPGTGVIGGGIITPPSTNVMQINTNGPHITSIYDASNDTVIDEAIYTGITVTDIRNEYPVGSTGIIIGSSNKLDETNFFIDGNNNIVSVSDVTLIASDNNRVDSEAILIGSNNNIIQSGLTNILLINTQGVTIDTSGMSYINGVPFTTSGFTGLNGTSGTSGINGTSGTSGINGTSGTSGINGTSGTSGTSPTFLKEGDLTQGGIVAACWFNSSNYQQALIMSLDQISTGSTWINATLTGVTLGVSSEIEGYINTNTIINNTGMTTSAAKLCVDYTGGTYDDWYLPSLYELKTIYDNIYLLNKILGANAVPFLEHWSSTEGGSGAYTLQPQFGYTHTQAKNISYAVRAVRFYNTMP